MSDFRLVETCPPYFPRARSAISSRLLGKKNDGLSVGKFEDFETHFLNKIVLKTCKIP
jgi:hypothetical protein